MPVGPDEKATEVAPLIEQGIRALDAGRYDQAILRMQEALKSDPRNSNANNYINKAKNARALQPKQRSIRNLLQGAKSDLDNNNFDRSIERARQVIGATNPLEASPGSIRGDYAIEVGQNMVHGSDSAESATREVGLFFPEL